MPGAATADAPKSEEILQKKVLFDENDSSSDDDQEDGGATLGINKEFARRFEHNKKREERQRLEEKFKARGENVDGSDSSEDEPEDDEGFLVTDQLDQEISAVLTAIKKKDPRIYDKEAVFFTPVDAEAGGAETKAKKEKAMTIKDYHRERYLKGDIGAEDEENSQPKNSWVSYDQKQDRLKKELLAAAEEDDDEEEEWSGDDAFLKPKEKPQRVEEEPSMTKDGVHVERSAATQITEDDVANADKNPEEYLTKFMASRAWAPESGLDWKPFDSDDDDDEAQADEFEHAYNMRFEDPEKSNEVLKTYSRTLTSARSVRKEEVTGRKKQRMLEKERKEAEKKQLNEDRARLRRLKLDEASEKLAKIKVAAGMSGRALSDEEWLQFLDEKWDDDQWEVEMQKKFGEEYYAEPDDMSLDSGGSDEEDGSTKKKKAKKPKWDDDIDIGDIVPDFEEQEKPNFTLSDSDVEPQEPNEGEEDEADSDDDERPAKKRKTTKELKKEKMQQKRQARQEHAKLGALVDAKILQEEIENPPVPASSSKKASIPFRYRETSPNSFGLTARDILLAPSDAALNEFAGLKKLAAFRDAEKKRKDKKRLGKKARLRQWRRETFGKEFEHTGPTYGFERVLAEDDERKMEHPGNKRKAIEAAPNGDANGSNVVEGERKKKRKRSKGKKAAGVQV